MKICWLTTVAAPYTINLFKRIAKTEELCVVMHDAKEENRNDDWKIIESDSFKLYVVDNNYKKKIKEFAEYYDIFVDGMYLSFYGAYATKVFNEKNKPTVMAADGGVPRNRGFIINGIMSYLMNRHKHFLSSSVVTDRYFNYYKVDRNIQHYRFTSLFEKDIASNKEYRNKKNQLRSELGFSDNFILLSVGRPIKVKGFDILLNAYMKTGLTDKIDLYIVGGEPQDDIRKIVSDNKLINVHFVGVISSEELRKYYAASDASIICSRGDVWGLVINEALSYGLPTISSNMCMAGVHFGELCVNPAICELEDTDEYAKQINKLYYDLDYREKMSSEGLEAIKGYTIENSAQDIINALSLL